MEPDCVLENDGGKNDGTGSGCIKENAWYSSSCEKGGKGSQWQPLPIGEGKN